VDATLKIALVAGGAAILGGLITAVVAPHVTWGIEQKRNKRDARIEAIHRWREMILGWRFYTDHGKPTTLHLDLERGWVSLEPHLSSAALQEVARYQGRAIPYDELDQLVTFLLAEIAKLEKRWKLI
jgi:hypothetical protein